MFQFDRCRCEREGDRRRDEGQETHWMRTKCIHRVFIQNVSLCHQSQLKLHSMAFWDIDDVSRSSRGSNIMNRLCNGVHIKFKNKDGSVSESILNDSFSSWDEDHQCQMLSQRPFNLSHKSYSWTETECISLITNSGHLLIAHYPGTPFPW